jgi:surface carbohydrate biosynthesis protein
MTVVYIPVEVTQREFWSSAILASYLVARGHKVYIFQDYLFDKYEYPEPGIFIGKNLFKTWGRFSLDAKLKAMNNGVKMYFLEQEALGTGSSPEQATSQYFESRFGSLPFASEALSIEHGDRFLAWSKLHAETVKRVLPDSMINITGSTLFASCKPEWRDLYNSFSLSIETPFFLACSSYCLSNGMAIYDFLKMSSKQFTQETITERLGFQAESIQFAIAIKKIADKLSNTAFLFRPHPSENCDIYDELFADSPNVLVSKEGTIQEVLANTCALIHSGCSTAIQASIMHVPVITLQITPSKFQSYPYLLMNLGYKCTEWAAVCTHITKTDNTINECDREYEEQIELDNTFEKIAELIDLESTVDSPIRPSKHAIIKHIKGNFSNLGFKLQDLYNTFILSKSSSCLSGWAATDFNRFPDAVKSISKRKFGINICTQQLASNCYIFSHPSK